MFNNDWDVILKDEINSEYFRKIISFLDQEYIEKDIFPNRKDIFKALQITPFNRVRVVILGQDPYHGIGQANGLAFALQPSSKVTPSLRNIIKELNSDLKVQVSNIKFEDWSRQGILLLNSVLTVESNRPGSHQKIGWQRFTDEIISRLNNKSTPIIFILWGNYAISKENLITNQHHLIIKSTHPSPFSANKGFLGSKPFSKTNAFLKDKPIKWY